MLAQAKIEFEILTSVSTGSARYSAVWALQQPVVDVRPAIATFGFIIFGWRGDTGGHENLY